MNNIALCRKYMYTKKKFLYRRFLRYIILFIISQFNTILNHGIFRDGKKKMKTTIDFRDNVKDGSRKEQ